jgi:hypothetical membrane protein
MQRPLELLKRLRPVHADSSADTGQNDRGKRLMKTETRLLFGPVAAIIFFSGVVCLALFVPGYSHLHQSISAIGKMGTPMRIPFALVIACYAGSLLIFASGIYRVAVESRVSKVPAYWLGFLALTQFGIAIFATPHPLHNIFGLLGLLGDLVPLVLAFAWRRIGPQNLTVISWILGLLVLAALILNLSELVPQSALWQLVEPYPGLAQRVFVAVWLTWLIAAGVTMRRKRVE